jgi:16S rRNA (cytosine967-C5)-methyltransferase
MRSAAAGAPLAQVLRAAAQAWVLVRSGQSLERALLAHAAARGASPTPFCAAVRDVSHDAVRHRALIDALLHRLVRRPAPAQVTGLLAAALSQLLDGAYPDYVVVDQAVGAARTDPSLRPSAGFVNAVLRAFLRRRTVLLPPLMADDATALNVPSWWLQRMQRDHPQAWRAALDEGRRAPPLTVRVNCRRLSAEAYLERLRVEGVAASRVGASAVWLHRPVPVGRIPGFREGLVSVQDAGAQLAAPWLGADDSTRVLDACAAPGGKTGHLAELCDASIDALEIDPQRALRIGENLDRLGLAQPRVRVVVGDAAKPATFWDGRPYQRILLDAPCTGSGIVRRHVDIPWLRRETDVAQLATIQAGLLDAMWPLLAPAGRLLYVVCSVFREEAALQADGFLQRHPDARLMPLPDTQTSPLPLSASVHLPSCVQLLPSSVEPAGAGDPTGLPSMHDGFFFALFRKDEKGR